MSSGISKRPAARGIDVREQINQGFVRSELGSAADAKADSVYQSAEVSPALLRRHASAAELNYMAAISCFLRALPSIKDTRSLRLIKTEVNRLLRRLEGMRALLREADRLDAINNGNPVALEPWERIDYCPEEGFDWQHLVQEFDDDLEDAFNKLSLDDNADGSDQAGPVHDKRPLVDQSAMFQPGTPVEVKMRNGSWEPAEVVSLDRNTYNVRFPDNAEEQGVAEERVRARQVQDERVVDSLEHSEHLQRMEVMSEIIESERQYNLDLQNLDEHFIRVLRNPSHWGGQKDGSETWFSQRTLDEEEGKQVFANMPDIIEMNRSFLSALEAAFAKMECDQSLATVFLDFAPRFKLYSEYIVQFEESQRLIAKFRKERSGFESADKLAAALNVPPLAELMKKPVNRIKTYMSQLQRLNERTPAAHQSFDATKSAIVEFRKVQIFMAQAIHVRENQAQLHHIEASFSPSLKLASPSRFFIHRGQLARIEDRNGKDRLIFLFNDLVICAKASRWLAPGSLREKGRLQLGSYGAAPDFGPHAFFVSERPSGNRWVLVASNFEEKELWFSKLKMCSCDPAGRLAVRPTPRVASPVSPGTPVSTLRGQVGGAASPVAPPPPPPPALPPGWVELTDSRSGRRYYFNSAIQKTQWERPTA